MGIRHDGEIASHRLYEMDGNGRRRIVALVSRRKGERMVRVGLAEEMLDWDGKTLCYRSKQDARALSRALGMHDSFEVVSVPSCAALSRREMDAVAGTAFKFGKSQTAGLSEEKRLGRVHPKTHRVLPAEDLVERATVKLQAWARIGPAIAALGQ